MAIMYRIYIQKFSWLCTLSGFLHFKFHRPLLLDSKLDYIAKKGLDCFRILKYVWIKCRNFCVRCCSRSTFIVSHTHFNIGNVCKYIQYHAYKQYRTLSKTSVRWARFVRHTNFHVIKFHSSLTDCENSENLWLYGMWKVLSTHTHTHTQSQSKLKPFGCC